MSGPTWDQVFSSVYSVVNAVLITAFLLDGAKDWRPLCVALITLALSLLYDIRGELRRANPSQAASEDSDGGRVAPVSRSGWAVPRHSQPGVPPATGGDPR